MAGLLDWIGERLDTPLQGVGVDPSKMSDAEKWGMRGRVISAFGGQLGTNPQSFYGQLDNIAGSYQEQQQKQEQQLQAQQMQQMMAQAAQAGGSNADVYMRYAQMFAQQGKADLAKKYFDMAQALQPKDPEYGAPQEVTGPDGKPMLAQFDKAGGMRPVQGVQPKAEATPNAIREYNYSVTRDGYKGTFQQWTLEQKKAGASNVNVNNSTNIDPSKKLGDTLGTGVGDVINNTFAGAQAAQSTLGNVTQIRNALGNAITGPFADQRAFLARLQSGLGVAAGETPERLADTQRVLSGLARAELSAASQMRGQGAITDSERAILKRAEAGEISLSPSEIRVVVDALESTANRRIAAHQTNLGRLRKLPGAESLIPFYELDDTPAATPGAPVVNPAAVQAEIARRRAAQGGR